MKRTEYNNEFINAIVRTKEWGLNPGEIASPDIADALCYAKLDEIGSGILACGFPFSAGK